MKNYLISIIILAAAYLSMPQAAVAQGDKDCTDDTLWTRSLIPENAKACRFTPDGKYVLAAVGKTLCKYDALTGALVSRFKDTCDDIINHFAWSKKGTIIVLTTIKNNKIYIWDYNLEKIIRILKFKNNSKCVSIATTYDDKYLMFGVNNIDSNIVFIYNLDSMKLEKKKFSVSGQVTSLIISPHNLHFIISTISIDKLDNQHYSYHSLYSLKNFHLIKELTKNKITTYSSDSSVTSRLHPKKQSTKTPQTIHPVEWTEPSYLPQPTPPPQGKQSVFDQVYVPGLSKNPPMATVPQSTKEALDAIINNAGYSMTAQGPTAYSAQMPPKPVNTEGIMTKDEFDKRVEELSKQVEPGFGYSFEAQDFGPVTNQEAIDYMAGLNENIQRTQLMPTLNAYDQLLKYVNENNAKARLLNARGSEGPYQDYYLSNGTVAGPMGTEPGLSKMPPPIPDFRGVQPYHDLPATQRGSMAVRIEQNGKSAQQIQDNLILNDLMISFSLNILKINFNLNRATSMELKIFDKWGNQKYQCYLENLTPGNNTIYKEINLLPGWYNAILVSGIHQFEKKFLINL